MKASMAAVIRTLFAIDGGPIRTWDSRGHVQRLTYDAGRRPLDLFIADAGGEYLRSRKIYGEAQGAAQNLRGRNIRCSTAPASSPTLPMISKAIWCTRAGNSPRTIRRSRLGNTVLADESFEGAARFDAVGRQIQIVAPRSSRPGAPINGRAAALQRSRAAQRDQRLAWRRHGADQSARSATATRKAVEAVTYDAKGQRRRSVTAMASPRLSLRCGDASPRQRDDDAR
ncbi:hypothetical protein F2981_32795 (plasmid) [Sinorhizobium meliloti]|nr:hypothetical protein [Sinorhizobium meliloti]